MTLVLVILLVALAAALLVGSSRRNAARQAAAALSGQLAEAASAAHEFRVGLEADRRDLQEALVGLRERADALATTAAPQAPEERPTPPRRRLADVTADYWREPPVVLASDDLIAARMKAAAELSHDVEVCFTGWTDDEKGALEADARGCGFVVRTAVAKHLTFLCCGATPGPVKVENATQHGVAIISGDQFSRLVWRNDLRDIPF